MKLLVQSLRVRHSPGSRVDSVKELVAAVEVAEDVVPPVPSAAEPPDPPAELPPALPWWCSTEMLPPQATKESAIPKEAIRMTRL